nr:prenyltransferase [uncultured Halomonas sp.]
MAAKLLACVQATRPPFLLLAPLCALLGVTAALAAGLAPGVTDTLLVLGGSVSAHAAANLLNEYHDFRSGLDALTRRTPFSGGSGVLPACPEAAPLVASSALGCLLITLAIGAYFLLQRGPAMLGFGIAGLALVVAYSGWIVRRPLLCLLAPGLGFGPLMGLGAHWAVSGRLSMPVLVAMPLPLLLVSALLLVNQLPDIDADRRVGRRHLAIALGPGHAARVAALLNVLAFAVLASGLMLGGLPNTLWPALALALPALWLAVGLWRLEAGDLQGDRTHLLRLMAMQVAVLLLTLATLDVGLWWSA